MGEWQDIETAPKDGRLLLLCRQGFVPALGCWVDLSRLGCWGRKPHGGKWEGWIAQDPESFEDDDDLHEHLVSSDYEPTHWMPLPDPPTDGGDQ